MAMRMIANRAARIVVRGADYAWDLNGKKK